MKWNQLIDIGQLDEIIDESIDKPVVIFKHSTRCGVSRMVLKEFEKEFDLYDKITPYFIDLLTYRKLSNEIAHRFNVAHQSPQLLLITNGQAVYNVSHGDISARDLPHFLTKL